ncbi:DUF2235 domain-containing protein [Vallicoccus soli]|uniref:DUF2235 domain-containing protein n=1 Tax=Vallicoccus soli TaxID=2339232 RepID=UPI001403FA3D|nr:DUF2235 domain-containing protein [Vallicoccus soli]
MQRLVVLADGTWKSDEDASDRTNVEKLRDLVVQDDGGVLQDCRYLEGVGTRGGLDRWLGGAVGAGLSGKVLEGYRWLVERYRPDDQVFLLGFSRGAYTVRSLAGLVRNLGILRPEHAGRVDEAYAHYRDRDERWAPEGDLARRFRQAYAHPLPRIAFLGVWDTVGALGVPGGGPLAWWTRRRYGFHDVQLSGIVDRAYQALAIDERRGTFAPTLWTVDPAHAGHQVVRQTWFTGSHSDVGGGCPDSGLSDITLRWMAQGAAEAGLGLDTGRLPRDDRYDAPLHDSARALFRVLSLRDRAIGPAGSADVHRAARDRHERGVRPPYAPRNLLAWLQAQRGAGSRVPTA